MAVIGINGSPRKKWNTAQLLTQALEGAASQGAETELVHLYDLDFQGCTSCFACKLIDGPSNGRCAVTDELTPVLRRIENEADALLLATPVYFGSQSGEMRSFMERMDPAQKAGRREQVFPDDRRRAFELGRRIASHTPMGVDGC